MLLAGIVACFLFLDVEGGVIAKEDEDKFGKRVKRLQYIVKTGRVTFTLKPVENCPVSPGADQFCKWDCLNKIGADMIYGEVFTLHRLDQCYVCECKKTKYVREKTKSVRERKYTSCRKQFCPPEHLLKQCKKILEIGERRCCRVCADNTQENLPQPTKFPPFTFSPFTFPLGGCGGDGGGLKGIFPPLPGGGGGGGVPGKGFPFNEADDEVRVVE